MNGEPKVLFWYRLYCGAMALLYVGCTALAAAVVVWRKELGDGESMGSAMFAAYGAVLIAVSLGLVAAFVATFFLPRKPWAWIAHLVLIALGFGSACCLPACIPLLIHWIKPETKAWFGRTA
jgi:hypothetical protein